MLSRSNAAVGSDAPGSWNTSRSCASRPRGASVKRSPRASQGFSAGAPSKRASGGSRRCWEYMRRGCGSGYASASRDLRFTASGFADAAADPRSNLVLHAHDVVAALPARRLELERIAFIPADQRTRDRRGHRDAALLDVGFQVADDLVDDRISAVLVFEFDGGAEHHARAGVEARDINDFGGGQARFQLLDAALDEALLFACGMVLGVLLEVAVRARFGDRGDHLRPLHRFQALQFGAQTIGAGFGHGGSFHWLAFFSNHSPWVSRDTQK